VSRALHLVLRVLGIGALVAGGLAVAVLVVAAVVLTPAAFS